MQGKAGDARVTGEDREALWSVLTAAEADRYYDRMGRHGIRSVRALAQRGRRVLEHLGARGPDVKRLRNAIRCAEGMVEEPDAELAAVANLTVEEKLMLMHPGLTTQRAEVCARHAHGDYGLAEQLAGKGLAESQAAAEMENVPEAKEDKEYGQEKEEDEEKEEDGGELVDEGANENATDMAAEWSPPHRAQLRTRTTRISQTRGLVGMKNMGNTCYMNACIQCLSHTFELSSVFMKITGQDINRSSQSKGLIATEFANLIRTVWAERPRSVFEPARLKKQIGKLNETFAGFAQQDSQELLRFLLDGAPQPHAMLCPPAWRVDFCRASASSMYGCSAQVCTRTSIASAKSRRGTSWRILTASLTPQRPRGSGTTTSSETPLPSAPLPPALTRVLALTAAVFCRSGICSLGS